jgi:hypothetical protein
LLALLVILVITHRASKYYKIVGDILSAPKGRGASYTSSIVRTYRRVFKNVQIFQVDKTAGPEDLQNILLLASQEPLAAPIDILHDPLVYSESEGMILTDDFAPVEQMVASQE